MSSPLISVVIPSFNHQQYVVEALQSIWAQTHECVEVIFVDDRSQDATLSAAKEFLNASTVKSRFDRVLVLENRFNAGAHASINRGINESRGEFVAVLNSDDAFAPTRLATLLEACQREKARLAFSTVRVIGSSGEPPPRREVERLQALQESVDFFPTVGFALLAHNVALSTGNFFFERSLFTDVGEFTSLRYCHDWDFMLRAVLTTEPLFVRKPLYSYRVHGANSFLALESVAAAETRTVVSRYLFLCRNRPVANPLAPSPAWGKYFDDFLRSQQYEPFLRTP